MILVRDASSIAKSRSDCFKEYTNKKGCVEIHSLFCNYSVIENYPATASFPNTSICHSSSSVFKLTNTCTPFAHRPHHHSSANTRFLIRRDVGGTEHAERCFERTPTGQFRAAVFAVRMTGDTARQTDALGPPFRTTDNALRFTNLPC